MSARQFTVIRKPAGKPSGDADLMYRGADLARAKDAAYSAVIYPAVPQAVIYEDRLEPNGTFVFTGATWGWAEAGPNFRYLRSVEDEAARAARALDDELHLHRRALVAHLRDVPHQGEKPLAGAELQSTLLNMEVGLAIRIIEAVHRTGHPYATDPYHEVKP